MSTVTWNRSGASAGARVRPRALSAPSVLAGALLLVILYAAFEHGAVSLAAEARMQVAIDAILAAAGAAVLWTGSLSLRASRLALAGVAALLGFAIWSAVTLIWSVAPNQTWIEFNRDLTYVVVLLLAIVLGSSTGSPSKLLADGFLLIASVVTCYALGQKVLPGLHIPGLFDLNQTGSFPRLQEPLGYWNALALFIAYGTPLALARAADPARTARARAVPLLVLQLMLIAIGLTYSRGGLIALAIGLGIGIAVSGRWLPSLTWLAVAAIAAAPPLAYGLASHSLSTGGVSLASRQVAGLILLVVLALSSAVMLFGASRLRALEAERPLTPEGTRRVGRMLVALVGTALVAGVLAVSFSGRGLTGTVSHAWSSFTTTRVTSNTNPERLLSANSENRWVWWKEAAGAFSDRPIAGWGAGSFPVVHLLYRRNGLSVNQPHSVPLQFLSETGLVGTAVVALAFVLLIVAALRGVRRAGSGTERLVASALFAGVVMFLVHGLYDWDWDIPAMAIPALVFVGILCGGEGADRVGRLGYAARTAGVALVTLSACAFALSAALPSWAATKASDAIVQAAGSEADVSHAEATAALAARLDPLSNAGLLVEATIAARRGQIARVRSLLISATRRDPTDATAWFQLAFADLSVGDAKAASQAGRRALALDPYSSRQAALLQGIKRSEKRTGARPAASATAVPVRSP